MKNMKRVLRKFEEVMKRYRFIRENKCLVEYICIHSFFFSFNLFQALLEQQDEFLKKQKDVEKQIQVLLTKSTQQSVADEEEAEKRRKKWEEKRKIEKKRIKKSLDELKNKEEELKKKEEDLKKKEEDLKEVEKKGIKNRLISLIKNYQQKGENISPNHLLSVLKEVYEDVEDMKEIVKRNKPPHPDSNLVFDYNGNNDKPYNNKPSAFDNYMSRYRYGLSANSIV
jgi:DNA repair exonuclease SbcCD ATPase subunit